MARVSSKMRGGLSGDRWLVPFGTSLTVRARGSMNETASPAASVPAEVSRYLLPHERSCIAVRKHPAELAGPRILVAGGLVAAGELTRRSVRPKVVWGGYLSVLLYSLERVAAWRATYFAVTEVRMVLVSGFMVRKVAMMPLARVTDMSFRRSALGRLLGYGEFIVESAGEEQALRSIDFLPVSGAALLGGLRPCLPGRGGRDSAGSRRLARFTLLSCQVAIDLDHFAAVVDHVQHQSAAVASPDRPLATANNITGSARDLQRPRRHWLRIRVSVTFGRGLPTLAHQGRRWADSAWTRGTSSSARGVQSHCGRRGRHLQLDAASWQTPWMGERIDPPMSQITSPEQVTLAWDGNLSTAGSWSATPEGR